MQRAIHQAYITGILILGSAAQAHGEAEEPLAFEVASIKPSPPAGGPFRLGPDGGPGTKDPERFTCANCTLSMLVMSAYGIKRYQLVDSPALNGARFEVTAKVPAGATRKQLLEMLQALLAERFNLKIHREQREMPIYELVVAKNGSKLREAKPAVEDDTEVAPQISEADADGCPVIQRGEGVRFVIQGSHSCLRAVGETMEHFAGLLSNQLMKPVTNATALSRKYDFRLMWSPEFKRVTPDTAPADADSVPTLFAALPQQLGLKLEQKKGPVEVIVVDHMEKSPTEN